MTAFFKFPFLNDVIDPSKAPLAVLAEGGGGAEEAAEGGGGGGLDARIGGGGGGGTGELAAGGGGGGPGRGGDVDGVLIVTSLFGVVGVACRFTDFSSFSFNL